MINYLNKGLKMKKLLIVLVFGICCSVFSQSTVKYDPVLGKLREDDSRNTPISEVCINTVSDLPAPVDLGDGLGLAYRLNNGRYKFGGPLTLPYPIAPTAGAGNVFLDGGNFANITYSGSGAFLRANSTNKWGVFTVLDIAITGNGSNQIFDIDGDGTQLTSSFFVAFSNFDGVGTIANQAICQFQRDSFEDCKTLIMDSNNINFLFSMAVFGSTPFGGANFRIQGTSLTTEFQSFEAIPLSGDSVFDVDSAYTGLMSIAAVNVVTAYGGTAFKAGSLDQKDPKFISSHNRGLPDSQIVAGLYVRNNTTTTTTNIKGVTGYFQSAEVAGANTQINTTDTTGFANGNTIWLPNTIYSGKYTISNLVVNTSFEIATTFVSTAAGEYHKGWFKIAGTTIENEYSERSSMTANNVITFENPEEATLPLLFSYTVFGTPNADDIQVCIMKDDDILSESIKARSLAATPKEGLSNGLVPVISGDTVSPYVRNMSTNTRNVTFTHFNFSGSK